MTRLLGNSLFLLTIAFSAAYAQTANTACVASAKPIFLRAEGLTERTGDIVIGCTGQPNNSIQGNIAIDLNVNVTNRISTGNLLTGIVFTIDTGSGPQAVTVPAVLTKSNEVTYNGVSFNLSSTGTATLSISGIRGNASQIPVGSSVFAFIAVNGSNLLALTDPQVQVGTNERSLYASFSSRLVCAPNGSPLSSTDFAGLISSGAVFASTRITEGFADALQPRSGIANMSADTGERILVQYSGLPSGARLMVPDVVAGSDTVQPTAGGDFGVAASGGQYAPGTPGTLLLARVAGASASGAGGSPVYVPGVIGSSAVSFNTVSELTVTNGSAYVVYEVVDADSSRLESAQFPTFLGAPPSSGGGAVFVNETVNLAPVSAVSIATTSDPIPRFVSMTPLPDCSLVGDCGASYLPQLFVDQTALNYTGTAGGGYQVQYVRVLNQGGGAMRWTASISYPTGSPTGWLSVDPAAGINDTTIRLDANPANLQGGTYQATVTIDAGPLSGTKTFTVTFTVTPALPAPKIALPTISSVVNAATFLVAPAVPGSLTTIMGSTFGGKSVSVTFDGTPAQVLFSNASQINLLVPAGLSGPTSKVVVTVDGTSSATTTVNVAPFSPAIFKGAVLNQDWTVNGPNNPAPAGSIVQIYATGLSGTGTITGRIADRVISVPYYAGPAPGFSGVQQVDLRIPSDLGSMTADLYLCATPTNGAEVCSTPASLTVK